MTPVEFRGDLWLQKTRVPGLSCGVVRVILRLAILSELRLVTDRRTDRHRAMASTADASCGKNLGISLDIKAARQFIFGTQVGSLSKYVWMIDYFSTSEMVQDR